MEPRPIAAIDLGSNSAHLVVAKVNAEGQMHILDSEKISLRLGRAIDAEGNLSEEAIERTVSAFKHMREISKTYTKTVKAVATHATRQAKNYQELIKRIKKDTGISLEVIDGLEEARLTFLGMRQGLPIKDQRCLGVDIGGGSTEMILAQKDRIIQVASVKVGAVTMSKRFFDGDGIDTEQIQAATDYVEDQLSPVIDLFRGREFDIAVASSGTAKTLATVHAELYENHSLQDINGYAFPSEALASIYENMQDLADPKLIKSVLKVETNRADIILAGTLILDAIARSLGVEQWTVSTYSLREGIVLDAVDRRRKKRGSTTDIRLRNIIGLGDKMGIDNAYASRVSRLACRVFDQMQDIFPDSFPKSSRRELLKHAAYLHEIGKSISFRRFHKHSGYIISAANIMGFNEKEKQLMGHIARYHRKGLPTQEAASGDIVLSTHLNDVLQLAGCLRIAASLCRSRQALVSDVEISMSGSTLQILVKHSKKFFPHAEVYRLEKEGKHLQKIFPYKELQVTSEAI